MAAEEPSTSTNPGKRRRTFEYATPHKPSHWADYGPSDRAFACAFAGKFSYFVLCDAFDKEHVKPLKIVAAKAAAMVRSTRVSDTRWCARCASIEHAFAMVQSLVRYMHCHKLA